MCFALLTGLLVASYVLLLPITLHGILGHKGVVKTQISSCRSTLAADAHANPAFPFKFEKQNSKPHLA